MPFHVTAVEVASTVAAVGLGGFVSKLYFDARDTWWKRAEWAMDKAMSSDPLAKRIGIAAMRDLAGARVATKSDARVLRRALKLVLEEALDEPGQGGP